MVQLPPPIAEMPYYKGRLLFVGGRLRKTEAYSTLKYSLKCYTQHNNAWLPSAKSQAEPSTDQDYMDRRRQPSALRVTAKLLFGIITSCYAPHVGKGAISVVFVRPSVCPSVRPSVAYIANNSRTQRPSVSQFGKKVPHLWRDSHTSFKIKRSKVEVTRPINAHTYRALYLPNSKAYELQTCTRMEDDDPHQLQAP